MKTHLNLNRDEVSKITDVFLKSLGEALVSEENTYLGFVGWGSFEVKDTAERIGRNPKTGVEIKIPAKKAVKFKAGKSILEKINPVKEIPKAKAKKTK